MILDTRDESSGLQSADPDQAFVSALLVVGDGKMRREKRCIREKTSREQARV